jgi:nucleoside-diphosphate-sugar epimerase
MSLITKLPILVTGGSGYIASWIIDKLLERGYQVNTTVRDLQNSSKVYHLKEIAIKHKGILNFFEADLLKPNSFKTALENCEYVIHAASPFFVQGITDPQKELIDPALQGTINLLNSVNSTPTIKRVVLTSSVAAIQSDNKDLEKTQNNIFTEEHWNSESSLYHNPYAYSKTLAEKRAWEIASTQNRWDLITINPSFVLGPALSKRTDSTSVQTIIQLCNGTFRIGVPNLMFGITDVRDVAEAHILALINPNAKGRNIVNNESLTLMQIANTIKIAFPNKFPLPTFELPTFLIWLFGPLLGFSHKFVERNIEVPIKFDNTYSKQNLGLQYTDTNNTIIDQIKQLMKDNILK